MKTNNYFITVLLTISMMLISCTNIEVSTILNADGSLERIMEVRSDSELKDYKELPFPIDSTWKTEYKKDTSGSDKPHIYTFKKYFKNADEINLEYKNQPNALSKFERSLKVERKFRWFYTYLSYNEEYKKMARGKYKPFEMYLSDIEKEVRNIDDKDSLAQILQMDSLASDNFKKGIDKKFEKWLDDNLTDEILIILEQDIKNFHVKGISSENLNVKSDTIYKLADKLLGNKEPNDFFKAMNSLFKTTEFDKIINSQKSGLNEIEEEIGYVVALSTFKYKLKMPGLLIDTNSESIKGNQLDWEFVPFEAYFVGISQSAESRIINLWTFVISGIFLVGVVLVLFVPALKRRKQNLERI